MYVYSGKVETLKSLSDFISRWAFPLTPYPSRMFSTMRNVGDMMAYANFGMSESNWWQKVTLRRTESSRKQRLLDLTCYQAIVKAEVVRVNWRSEQKPCTIEVWWLPMLLLLLEASSAKKRPWRRWAKGRCDNVFCSKELRHWYRVSQSNHSWIWLRSLLRVLRRVIA